MDFLKKLFDLLPTRWAYVVAAIVCLLLAYFAVSCSTTLTHSIRMRTPEGEYHLVDSLDSSTRQLR